MQRVLVLLFVVSSVSAFYMGNLYQPFYYQRFMEGREMNPDWSALASPSKPLAGAVEATGEKQKRLRPCFYSPIQCLIKRGAETAEQPAH